MRRIRPLFALLMLSSLAACGTVDTAFASGASRAVPASEPIPEAAAAPPRAKPVIAEAVEHPVRVSIIPEATQPVTPPKTILAKPKPELDPFWQGCGPCGMG